MNATRLWVRVYTKYESRHTQLRRSIAEVLLEHGMAGYGSITYDGKTLMPYAENYSTLLTEDLYKLIAKSFEEALTLEEIEIKLEVFMKRLKLFISEDITKDYYSPRDYVPLFLRYGSWSQNTDMAPNAVEFHKQEEALIEFLHSAKFMHDLLES